MPVKKKLHSYRISKSKNSKLSNFYIDKKLIFTFKSMEAYKTKQDILMGNLDSAQLWFWGVKFVNPDYSKYNNTEDQPCVAYEIPTSRLLDINSNPIQLEGLLSYVSSKSKSAKGSTTKQSSSKDKLSKLDELTTLKLSYIIMVLTIFESSEYDPKQVVKDSEGLLSKTTGNYIDYACLSTYVNIVLPGLKGSLRDCTNEDEIQHKIFSIIEPMIHWYKGDTYINIMKDIYTLIKKGNKIKLKVAHTKSDINNYLTLTKINTYINRLIRIYSKYLYTHEGLLH